MHLFCLCGLTGYPKRALRVTDAMSATLKGRIMITLESTQEQIDFIIKKFDADLAQGKNWLVSATRANDKAFIKSSMQHINENEVLRRIITRQTPNNFK